MKKSLLWIVVLILSISMIAAFSFAGCKAAAEEKAPAEEAVEEAPAEGAPAEEAAAAEVTFDKPVTITVATWHPDSTLLDPQIAAFNKIYPNITVEYTWSNYTDYIPLLKSAFAAGKPADISGFQPGAMISDYTQFLEPLAPLCEAEWGQNWQDLIYDFCNEQVEWTGEEYYMMPLSWTPTGTWANVKLLKDNGLEIPKNLKDLENVRDTLKPKGLFTLFCGFISNWNAMDTFQFVMDEYCPGLFYEAQEGKASFDDPKFVDALKAWENLFDSEIIQPGAYSIDTYMDTVNPFNEGKQGAMIVNGSWHLGSAYLNQFQVELQVGGFSPIKFPDLNGDGKQPRPTIAMGHGFGIYKDIKDPYEKAAAWEFVKFCASGEGAVIYADGFIGFPTFKSAKAHDSAYDGAGDAKEEFKASVQWYFDNADSQGGREPKYAELKQGLYDIMAAVATGQQTPEEAAKYMQEVSAEIER